MNKINVKIVKHKPIDDNNKPANVIFDRICSTAFGSDFRSTSLKKIIISNNRKINFKPLKLQNVLNDYIHIEHSDR